MKKNYLKIIIFIILFFLLDNAIGSAISFMFNRSDRYIPRIIALKRPSVFYFGTSKTKHGIIPAAVFRETGLNGYNAAAAGYGIVESCGFEKVILAETKPGLMVVEAMQFKPDYNAINDLAPYLGYPQIRDMLKIFPLRVRLFYALFKTARYNSKKFFHFSDKNDGYKPLYGISPMINIEEPYSPADGSTEIARMMEGFLRQAADNGVRVIIVRMPMFFQDDKAGYYEVYKKLAALYGQEMLDLSREAIGRDVLPDDCFWDIGHLNDKGARIFSSILGKKIAAYLENNY